MLKEIKGTVEKYVDYDKPNKECIWKTVISSNRVMPAALHSRKPTRLPIIFRTNCRK